MGREALAKEVFLKCCRVCGARSRSEGTGGGGDRSR